MDRCEVCATTDELASYDGRPLCVACIAETGDIEGSERAREKLALGQKPILLSGVSTKFRLTFPYRDPGDPDADQS